MSGRGSKVAIDESRADGTFGGKSPARQLIDTASDGRGVWCKRVVLRSRGRPIPVRNSVRIHPHGVSDVDDLDIADRAMDPIAVACIDEVGSKLADALVDASRRDEPGMKKSHA